MKLRDIGYIACFAVILLDQLTKHFIMASAPFEGLITSVTSFFDLVLVWNKGISFGMLKLGHDVMPYVLSALALVICFGLNRWLQEATSKWLAVCLGLIMGGAIGNVIDRLVYGAVIDFIDFHVTIAGKAHHWPAFNIADSAICIGVVMLLLGGRHKTA